MDVLPLELIQYMFDYLIFKDQINLKSLSKNYYHSLRIYDLYNIPEKYKDKLSDEILKNYSYIKYLDVSNNSNIKNINNLFNLQKLTAGRLCYDCKINDNDIKNLNLIELSIYNSDITNLNHLTNLKKLTIQNIKSKISNEGIKNLNLEELCLFNDFDNKITNLSHMINLNHMTNLKILYIYFGCQINDECIEDLNLEELYLYVNCKSDNKITNLNHMTNLKKILVFSWKFEYIPNVEKLKNFNLKGLKLSKGNGYYQLSN